jgi:hypothetical protein
MTTVPAETPAARCALCAKEVTQWALNAFHGYCADCAVMLYSHEKDVSRWAGVASEFKAGKACWHCGRRLDSRAKGETLQTGQTESLARYAGWS